MKKSLFPTIGIIMYMILSIVNKFIVKVPDYIYISVGLLSIILIIIGLIKDRKNKQAKKIKS